MLGRRFPSPWTVEHIAARSGRGRPVRRGLIPLQIAMMTTTAIFTLAFFLLETCSKSNMRWLSSIEDSMLDDPGFEVA
jgi:hypothetical protein